MSEEFNYCVIKMTSGSITGLHPRRQTVTRNRHITRSLSYVLVNVRGLRDRSSRQGPTAHGPRHTSCDLLDFI